MREYLFRGKRVDNGEWVEGYLGYNKVRKQYYIMDDVDSFPIPVHKESVGQYTGIKDRNGRKIFEGDIIQRAWNGYPTIYRVVFDGLLAAFIGEVKPYGQFTTFDGDGEYFEVIGNVFENENLLEG